MTEGRERTVVLRAGDRVALGYRLAGRHRRLTGTVTGPDARGLVCVRFDDGGAGCFSAGALLTRIPAQAPNPGESRVRTAPS
ncbi:MAG: hypothetical protein M3Q10_11675 [Chloroflexota bacterium]|nr:hypothetical protein [Chloroflexota bacterium]